MVKQEGDIYTAAAWTKWCQDNNALVSSWSQLEAQNYKNLFVNGYLQCKDDSFGAPTTQLMFGSGLISGTVTGSVIALIVGLILIKPTSKPEFGNKEPIATIIESPDKHLSVNHYDKQLFDLKVEQGVVREKFEEITRMVATVAELDKAFKHHDRRLYNLELAEEDIRKKLKP